MAGHIDHVIIERGDGFFIGTGEGIDLYVKCSPDGRVIVSNDACLGEPDRDIEATAEGWYAIEGKDSQRGVRLQWGHKQVPQP